MIFGDSSLKRPLVVLCDTTFDKLAWGIRTAKSEGALMCCSRTFWVAKRCAISMSGQLYGMLKKNVIISNPSQDGFGKIKKNWQHVRLSKFANILNCRGEVKRLILKKDRRLHFPLVRNRMKTLLRQSRLRDFPVENVVVVCSRCPVSIVL